MKKYYYFILLIFSIANHTIGITQCGWQPVGPNNFNQPSYSSTSNASLVTDHKGSVYTISTLSNPTLVQLTKYTGNIWQQFPLFDAFDMDIMHWSCTIDSSGAPYFAYIDGTTPTPNYLSVIKYNGSKWVFVGAEGFSPGVAAFPSIATDKTGIPYVAYIDVTTGKIPVRKYSGTSWIYVGSSGGVTAQNSGEPSLAFNSSGTLYMAFTDGNYKGKATVMQYNGTNWVNVGTPGFSLSDADSIQLKISDHDTLYVAFKDWANSKKLTVMKFNGINWVTIGTAGFTKASGVCFSLAIDTTETPWVSFLDHSNNEKANLVKYTGGSWTNITPTHILNDSNYSCINFNSSGVPYFLYQTNFHVGDLARVLKYDTIWHEAGDTSLCESSGAESILSDDSGNVFISYFDYYKRATSVEECKHGTNSWTFVGKQAFASGVSVLTLDKQGIPYVAFSDPVSGKASVMEFQDTAWVYIGPPQFTSGKASPYGIAVDAGGVPYIVMSDFNTGYYASVMKFNGTNWVYVDIPGFSNITFQNIILGINKANNIYVTYNNKFQYYNGTHFVDYSGKFYDSLSTEVLSLTFDSLGSPYLTYHDQAGLCSVSRYNGTHW
ncbi:MAG TPA: hypothetical protein VN922_16440, partial [Bacteroidia bacterium]|nr:hypothetical protein [Bacteroidia bacterium]